MRPSFRLASAVAGLATVALAACSGGGGGGGPVTVPTATASVSVPTATPMPTPSPVTMANSGSTNTRAFTIVLHFDGTGTLTRNTSDGAAPAGSGGAGTSAVTPGAATAAHTSQLFADLAANAPVSAISTTAACTKSASFGTSTTLQWNGSTSGDISCSSSAGGMALFQDASNVDADFGVTP